MKPALISITIIATALILALPVTFYIYQDFNYKNKVLSEKEHVKKLNQDAYDKCIRIAEYEYKKEMRDQCWVYNHDATECDLSYLETYDVGETPITQFKKDMATCDDKYPANERLYSTTSPDYESLLATPIGKLSEREAVRKILSLQEFKDFAEKPDGTLRYSVEEPTEDIAYWLIHIYADDEPGKEDTLNYYKVDAFTGKISTSKTNE
jgi:hypothetical protein